MSARSLSSKQHSQFFVFFVFFSSQCHAQATYKGIQDDRTTATKQGLYEIQQEAHEFIEAYNRKHSIKYEAMDPDLRIVVARCATPLKVKWLRDTKHRNGNVIVLTKSVSVICTKTIIGSFEKDWNVEVPVTKLQSPTLAN